MLVSGTIVTAGPSATILTAWRWGRFTLLMSTWQRAELARVLARPRIVRKYQLTPDRLAAFFLLVDTVTTPVVPLGTLPVVVRDPNDIPILGMALAGRATHVVTGDDDLLVLAGALCGSCRRAFSWTNSHGGEEGTMCKRRSRPRPQATLADGYQSIPALKSPKTEEEIAAIVRDERAEEEWKRIERAAKAEHVARAVAKMRDQGR